MENNIEELKIRAEAHLRQVKAEREKRIKEYWENIPKFNNPEDIPELPRVDEKEWKEFYVPKMIEAGAIPKTKLIDGQYYIGEHRRGNVAKWNEKENRFTYRRDKFGQVFDDYCNHFEDDDGFALFVPIRIGTEEEYNNNQVNR